MAYLLQCIACFLKQRSLTGHNNNNIAVLSTFFTRRGFFNFSILNPFSLAKIISMNRLVAPLSKNAFTTTPLWFSNFSSSTFNQTFLSGRNMRHTSLILSVVLVKFDLLPSFSGRNTLYKLLEASQELTVLYFFLLTPMAFLLPVRRRLYFHL